MLAALALGADPNLGIDNPIAVEHAAPSALKAALFGGFNQLQSTVTFEALIQARRKVLGVLLAHGARFPVEKNSDAEKMLLAATTGDLATDRRLLAAGVSPMSRIAADGRPCSAPARSAIAPSCMPWSMPAPMSTCAMRWTSRRCSLPPGDTRILRTSASSSTRART